MNSPFAAIFLALQARIAGQLSAVRYIEQDLGQLKNSRPPVSWPCILIDFEDFSFGDLSENVQTASGTVVLQLGFAPYSASSQATPGTNIDLALGFFDLEWSLHRILQGWSPGDSFGSLNRRETTTQKRNDKYRVREIRYTVAFEDYSAKLTQTLVPATILISEQVNVR